MAYNSSQPILPPGSQSSKVYGHLKILPTSIQILEMAPKPIYYTIKMWGLPNNSPKTNLK